DTAAVSEAAVPLLDPESARLEGVALHALLNHLAGLPEETRVAAGEAALPLLAPELSDRHAALLAKAVSILTRPELALVFGPGCRGELPFETLARRRVAAIKIAGRIDRMVVLPDRVLVVDFKSDALPPARSDEVSAAYRAQLGI